MVFRFSSSEMGLRSFGIRLREARNRKGSGRLDENDRQNAQNEFTNRTLGGKITLTSTSAKLELKWFKKFKRKCLAKVK
ncbi:unnamed protein product [Rhizophagus irregularis]|nr:unnamed protein product [Rhizophagus irregularis]